MSEPGDQANENQVSVSGTARTRLDNAELPNEPVADAFGPPNAGPAIWQNKGWTEASGKTLTGMSGGAVVSKVQMSSDLGNAEVIGHTGTVALWESKGWSAPSG